MKKLTPWFLLLALCCFAMTAFAAESDELPANFLNGAHPIHDNPNDWAAQPWQLPYSAWLSRGRRHHHQLHWTFSSPGRFL